MRRDPLGWNESMEARHIIRSRKIPRSPGPDPDIYQVYLGSLKEIVFKVKKSKFDAWNSLYTFQGEENMRKQFFYPYLPCVFLDVGCCLGSWTLPALAMESDVYGFEPDIRYLEDLVETIKMNDFNANFFGIDMAVFNKSGKIIKDFGEIQNIRTITIDKFVEWNNIKPQYIKIDVEGMEQYAIEGALRTLMKYKPKVFIENHEWALKEMTDWIKKRIEDIGYKYQNAGRISKDVRYSFFDYGVTA